MSEFETPKTDRDAKMKKRAQRQASAQCGVLVDDSSRGCSVCGYSGDDVDEVEDRGVE